ncbi:hypothetical protein D3C81_1327100 [compost metagenome]
MHKPGHGKNSDHPARIRNRHQLIITFAAHMRINRRSTGMRGNDRSTGYFTGIKRRPLATVPGINNYPQLIHSSDEANSVIGQTTVCLLRTP